MQEKRTAGWTKRSLNETNKRTDNKTVGRMDKISEQTDRGINEIISRLFITINIYLVTSIGKGCISRSPHERMDGETDGRTKTNGWLVRTSSLNVRNDWTA